MPGKADSFSYDTAFSRNIGWLTPEERLILRGKRVAIAGLGGVGGSHMLTLTRLGIARFHVADPDIFELVNFNRQAGASLGHIGQSKVDVLAEMAMAINPQLEIRKFSAGVNESNVNEFLDQVDVYVDGLDFFVVAARRMVFAACADKGIPAVTAAPLGMGTALLNFLPGRMTFEEYFQLEGYSEEDQLIRFLLGLSPAMLQRGYLVRPEAVDFARQRGPSTAMACEICAGVAATQTLKILLKRGRVVTAPRGLQFDPYRNRLARTWRPGGNRNPLQRLGLYIAKRQLASFKRTSPTPPAAGKPQTAAERILDSARWAPSGDNTQPWRFELKTEDHVVVHGFDTREHCVYDLQGHASQIALGALLENIIIAATQEGLRAEFARRTDAPAAKPIFDVRFSSDPSLAPDPLCPYIRIRTTQRRPMRKQPLTSEAKAALEQSVEPHFTLHWLEDLRARLRVARLLSLNGKFRLTLPEAYATHRDIIQWDSRFSEDKIPDRAVGMDAVGAKLMRWALHSWDRVNFLNTYLGGTLLPRVQLDFIPAVACAAHFVMVAAETPQSIDEHVLVGRSWQRFWLTATQHDLWCQPEMTPLIFCAYLRNGTKFTDNERSRRLAGTVSERLDEILTADVSRRAVVMGRIGTGAAPTARSVRLPLERLMVTPGDTPV